MDCGPVDLAIPLNGTATVDVLELVTVTAWRPMRREYRHRAGQCSRLLFTGILAPGSRIEIRCPACDRMHVIEAG